MTSQDLIYSVLARPLGNQVSRVKADVKAVSDLNRLKPVGEDEEKPQEPKKQAVERYQGEERRKNNRHRRKMYNRRGGEKAAKAMSKLKPKFASTPADTKEQQENSDGGLDLYA